MSLTPPDLTILCVTEGHPHAEQFVTDMAKHALALDALLVLAADCDPQPWMPSNTVRVHSKGYLESVLDEAIGHCPDGYILRLDDDERMSAALRAWLSTGSYRVADHWAFPRLNLWPDANSYIANPPLFPDLQTRLSVKAKAGGRDRIHAGSPYGTGRVCSHPIEHHKFLVRPLAERETLLDRYEGLQPGAGEDFAMFSVPERYADDLVIAQ